MKRVLLIFAILVSYQSFAQNWADSGAVWHYSYSLFNLEGFVELSEEGDTLIQGIEAKKIAKRLHYIDLVTGEDSLFLEGYEYMYSDSDHVYQLINNQFEVLYDFTVEVGDTVLVYNDMQDLIEENCDTVSRSLVTEIGVEMINGENLRWYRLAYIEGSSFSIAGKIIEKIGNIENYMFSMPSCFIWEEARGPFRCYEDDDFELYQNPEYEGECNSIPEMIPLYASMLDPSSVWQQTTSCWDPELSDEYWYYEYFNQGDTVIEGLEYDKMYISDDNGITHIGFIRENLTGQVYFRVNQSEYPAFCSLLSSEVLIGQELLLYDFSAEVGDTIEIPLADAIIEIEEVVYIDVYGESRKKLFFNIVFGDDNLSGYGSWVEGVGGIEEGLFNSYCVGFECITEMYCSSVNVNWVYGACDVSVDELSDANFQIQLFPNPSAGILNIDITENRKPAHIRIFDLGGKLLLDLNYGVSINISSLTSGMYLLEVESVDGYRAIDRFVKE